jgi:hypothetical protein
VKLFQIPTKARPMHDLLGYVRMDNIIEFPANRTESKGDPVIEFVLNQLIPWAMEQGLDVQSPQFRLNGATIMTCLQGMLLNDI